MRPTPFGGRVPAWVAARGKEEVILAIQPRFNPTLYDISEQRRTQVNILGDVVPGVMQIRPVKYSQESAVNALIA